MSQPIQVVNAFHAGRPGSGNPAAVCVLDGDDFPDAAWMQAVAAQMNLSETAFTHRLAGDPVADWALRWFTPAVEVDLCGHATLAAAHVLGLPQVRFATRSGVLLARRGEDGTVTLDFPANPPVPLTAAPQLPGLAAVAVYTTGALGDLLVELPDEQAVRALVPDLAALSRVDCRGVIVTARAADGAGYDFVSRFFAPAVGVDEDPVTGSAHTALAPLWSARLGRESLAGLQVSPRGGLVRTRLRGDRVELSGGAATVLEGRLFL
ncbi:PhzF family phenazine biosynthesis protein [Allorhizocola rhizosphaerae]|uniref:PhzF family phenazine biosynthesis protein n=1 Tax=Allorhizocola rhizosphaerae TaxID=1872709 RepID=UPI001FE934E1|nr:PhzF family phenazine biosynthesis protein [Allorhizocola rhizosphaerae]